MMVKTKKKVDAEQELRLEWEKSVEKAITDMQSAIKILHKIVKDKL
jgi:hypothetical protein